MSETEKADIVERLREYAGWAVYIRQRDLLNEAAAEIERLRALPSRDDVLRAIDDLTLVRENDSFDCGYNNALNDCERAIRALKKDQNNG